MTQNTKAAFRWSFVLLATAGFATAAWAQAASDAERQYRIARRLAAEGSPEASAALRKVVEIDPGGPLADDALVEQALLLDIPGWPRELGRIPPSARDAAEDLLARVLEDLPRADRAIEARYRRALLMLEPLEGRNPSAARVELLDAATSSGGEDWVRRARLALAWQHFEGGDAGRALDALQRLAIDYPRSEAADRARVWLAVLMMRDGEFGEAAALLQEILRGETSLEGEIRDLRELAVRGVLRAAGTGGRWAGGAPATAASPGIKSPNGLTSLPAGGFVLADRRRGVVIRYGGDGRLVKEWPMEDPQAVARDPLDRVWASAGGAVYLLEGETPTARYSLGKFGAAGALAVDERGAVWVADRKGTRIARIEPGSGPEILWDNGEGRVRGLGWTGRRLLAVDEKRALVFEVSPVDGTATTVFRTGLQRPVSLAVDPAGQFAVLDDKAGEVVLVGPGGDVRERTPTGGAGVTKPLLLGLGDDGSLLLYDGARGAVVRIP